LKPDPGVTFGVLDNGIRYAIMPNKEPPDRLSLRLYIHSGSLMEDDDQRGLAHFLEHMAFNGTRSFPEAEMVEYFQRLGLSFGADTNAHTSFDETVYKLELPKTSPDMLREGMRLLRDYADGMLLKDAEIDNERGVILSEKRTRDSASYRTYQARMKFLLPEARIPKRHPIGVEEVIKKVPRQRFVDYYEKWYTKDRMILAVVGDTTAAAVVPVLKEHFANFAGNEPSPSPDLGSIPAPTLRAKLHTEPEATTTSVALFIARPFADKQDSKAQRFDDTLRYLAHSVISRRLEILAKAEAAPFTSGSSYAYNWMNFLTAGALSLSCEPDKWQETLAVAEQELRRALKHGFTQAELDEAKAKIRQYYEDAVKTKSTRKSKTLSNALVSAFGDQEVYTSPEYDLELANVDLPKVTRQDTLVALRKIWGDGSALSVFVGGNLSLDDAEATILTAVRKSQAQPVSAPIEKAAKPFAYQHFGPAATVSSRKHDAQSDVHQLVLSNGVRLNLKRTEFQANRINIQIRFGNGELEAPADKPALGFLANATFTAGGLEAHSADELKRLFAGRNIGAGFQVGTDAFELSGATTPDDLRDQLRYMTAFLRAPGYRAEARRQAMKYFEQQEVSLRHTATGVYRNDVSRFIAGGDFRFGYPSKEQLEATTMDDLRGWLAKPLANSYMEVAVVGDFDADTLIPLVCETLGALPSRSAKKPRLEARRKLAFPPAERTRTFNFQSDIPKSLTIVLWPTGDMWDIKRTRRLGVLADVFSDRLRKKIREEIGEAYSPDAYSSSSDTYTDYGYIAAVIGTSPEQAGKIAKVVHEIAAELHDKGTDADELERATKPKLNMLKEWVRDNRYWLGSVAGSLQEHPERLEWTRTILSDFPSITVDEVNALAKQYLPADAARTMLVVPTSK
jgi:zinc protease